MTCTKCGKEVEGKFCPECGAPLVETPVEEISVAETPVTDVSQEIKPKKKANGFGIPAFVLSIISFITMAIDGLTTVIITLLALALSVLGLVLSNKMNMKKGLAIAALVVASVGLLVGIGLCASGDKPAPIDMSNIEPMPMPVVDPIIDLDDLFDDDGFVDFSDEFFDEPVLIEKEADEAYIIAYQDAYTYKSSIGAILSVVIFEIKNTGNTNLYLDAGAYDLEGENGKLVESQRHVSVYPNVIAPNESAYYFDASTLSDVDNVIDVTLIPRPQVSKAKIGLIRYEITDAEIVNDKVFGVKMCGRVEKTDDSVNNVIYVVAVLFNKDDNPMGVIMTLLTEELHVGDKVGFEQASIWLPSSVTADDIGRFETYSYPMQMQY